MLWLMSARHVLNMFTLVFSRRDWKHRGLEGFPLNTADGAEHFPAEALNHSRPVSRLDLTLWNSLHIVMTCVIVFKRGCIFMCNSFVEIMFAMDGASEWFHRFITLGKFTRLVLN